MKTLLTTGASALALCLMMSGGAKAQVLIDDLADLAVGIGDLVGGIEVGDLVDVDVSALTGLELGEDAGGGGIYQNTAFNIAPNVATTAVVAAPLDAAALAVLPEIVAAVGLAGTPNTGSGAVAIEIGVGELAAALGGSVESVDDIATTAVGVLANQGIQTSNATSTTVRDNTAIAYDGGSLDFQDEASNAAAQAGNSAASSAASFTELTIEGPTYGQINDTINDSTSGPLEDIYANNLAFNLAPMVATTAIVGTSVATDAISTTAVGVLANQSISIGLDGAGLTSALTGNFAGSGLTDE